MSFFSSYGETKVKKMKDNVTDYLASKDPEGMTEAQILEEEKRLTEISNRCALAHQAVERARKETETLVKTYNTRYDAAQLLQKQLDAETDPARKESLQNSLNTLLASLEKMAPEVEAKKGMLKSKEEIYNSLEETTKGAAARLKTIRARKEEMVDKLELAKMAEEAAKEKEDAAKLAAGIDDSDHDVAMNAIQHVIDKANAHAEAAKERTDLLKPTDTETQDENIAAALKHVQGADKPQDTTTRLSTLKRM
jgi:hypothetical protein